MRTRQSPINTAHITKQVQEESTTERHCAYFLPRLKPKRLPLRLPPESGCPSAAACGAAALASRAMACRLPTHRARSFSFAVCIRHCRVREKTLGLGVLSTKGTAVHCSRWSKPFSTPQCLVHRCHTPMSCPSGSAVPHSSKALCLVQGLVVLTCEPSESVSSSTKLRLL